MANVTIAIHSDFLSALSKLPSGIQTKTQNFIKKFSQNPFDTGINFEKISNPYDDKFYSGRVDKTYRVIIAIQETTHTYVLLWVDHHDEAYQWANTKKIEVNKLTGLLQLYDIIPITTEEKKVVNKIFDKYTDEQLIALGLPELQLPLVRSFVYITDFYGQKDAFSTDVAECLEFLLDGTSYSEVLSLIQPPEEPTGDFSMALSSENNSRSYTVVEGQEELKLMFEAPLEKWRVFLHPSQKKMVEKYFSGPARVSGEAGTGKTVVAMHRTKYLLSQGKKVLFTTFTANLVGDIENNIMKILSLQESKRLDIKSVDALITSYLSSKGKRYRIIYDEDELLGYWEKAIENSNEDMEYDTAFFMEEWRKIATVMDQLSVDKYVSTQRLDRGVRLNRLERLAVWHVFEEYILILNKSNIRDIDYATYEARVLLKKYRENPYDSIIVDECQDISANAFKFLRLYAGPEHENDMFIVGDAHQRIYKNKAILSRCNINIRGRSSILKINYRTTEETRRYAFSFLNGISFDDIDYETGELNKCISLTHGDEPFIKDFDSFDNQVDYLAEEIQKLHEADVKLEDICVVARTHKQIESTTIKLKTLGIPCYEINNNITDNDSEPGVRMATMHRVKGLEFRYVFVISVNRNIIPMETTNYDESDNEDNRIIERCLIYVALTRAQVRAYVLSYGNPSSFLLSNDC